MRPETRDPPSHKCASRKENIESKAPKAEWPRNKPWPALGTTVALKADADGNMGWE